ETSECFMFCVSDTTTSESYALSLHDALPIFWAGTTNGLYVLQKHEGKYIVTHKFTKKDGLASDEFSFNNTIYEDTDGKPSFFVRSEEHTSELQSRENLVCRLLLEKKKCNIS